MTERHDLHADTQAASGTWEGIDACIEAGSDGRMVTLIADQLARRFGCSLRLFRVVSTGDPGAESADPLLTRLHVQQAEADLELFRSLLSRAETDVELCALQNANGSGMCEALTAVHDHVVVLARPIDFPAVHLSTTVQHFLDDPSQAICVLPGSHGDQPDIRSIIVALDGSARTERAIDAAIHLLGDEGGTVHLVHVIALPDRTVLAEADGNVMQLRQKLVRAEQEQAKRYLANLTVGGFGDNIEIGHKVLEGTDPAQAILAFAHDASVDIVVLNGRGAGASARVPLGHVAKRIIDHAPIPVLVYRRPCHDHTTRQSRVPAQDVRLPESSAE